ncbi:MAG: hypothetical protein V1655_02175 [bacterium]
MPDYKLPTSELSDKDLERGYWFLTHKIFLKRLGYSLFIMFDLFLVLSFAYKITNYYSTEASDYEKMLNEFYDDNLNYENINAVIKGKDLQIGSVQIIPSGKKDEGNAYDLIAEIYNPNEDFRIDFNCHFAAGEKTQEMQSGFILPKEKKVLAFFSAGQAGEIQKSEIILDDIKFKKISPKEIIDPVLFIAERINFPFENLEMEKIESAEDLYKIKFDLKNETNYNYWDVDLTILLYQDSQIIGIDKISAGSFKSGEIKPLEINWYSYLSPNVKISILPEIDVFNKDSYMEFEGMQKGLTS